MKFLIGALFFCVVADASRGSLDFRSGHLAVGLAPSAPAFSWLGVDSLGRGESLDNVILTAKQPVSGWILAADGPGKFRYEKKGADGRSVKRPGPWKHPDDRQIRLRSEWTGGESAPPFLLLSRPARQPRHPARPARGETRDVSPAVRPASARSRQLPDRRAALRRLACDARRRQPENFVRIEFPPASPERRRVEYVLQTTLIYPHLAGLPDDRLFDGYRRSFLNLIQFLPREGMLGNNSSSDSCGFTFWEHSELGLQAPPLAPGLTVLDLVRVSLDRVSEGGLTYGQKGYGKSAVNPEAAPWAPPFDSLDTLPSFVIAGSQYIVGTGDRQWARKQFPWLVSLARQMLAQDQTGNGLIEYRLSGNANSWDGKMRPANWWDTIGFGHEDAYSNALAFRACQWLSRAASILGREAEAAEFAAAAAKIKVAYYPTFYDPATGVLAGWKSADGKLHDYWFTFVNGMAISFGLVEGAQANAIMDRMLRKIDEVGFKRFDLGLPGNLIPVRREDYTDGRKIFGGSVAADGSDGFQIYENGAATHCHAYWFVEALYKLGRVKDARRVYYPMLRSFSRGDFQDSPPTGCRRIGAAGMARRQATKGTCPTAISRSWPWPRTSRPALRADDPDH